MDFLNRCTDNLQQVISVSQEAAEVYGTSYIGTEHIVFAMLNCPDSTAYKLLVSCGAREEKFRVYFARSVQKRSDITGFTPRTKHIIQRALEIAYDSSSDSLVGTEHMLLAIMSASDCYAVKMLQAIGVNMAELASKVELAITDGYSDRSDEDEEESAFSEFAKIFNSQGNAWKRENLCRGG